jgi:hypothetical protein
MSGRYFRSGLIAGLALAALGMGGAAAQDNANGANVPDFMFTLWNRGLGPYDPPPEGPGPVQNPPDMPFLFENNRSNYRGDTSNPILQPWAAERIRAQSEKEDAGLEAGTSQQTCRPSGVPGIFQLNDTMQVVQAPDRVIFLYARGHQRREVHLNAKHPDNLPHTWYGHSVGHYEGDTLVVDTVGLNAEPWVDRYGTPQTEKMHVVERYRLVPNPNGGDPLLHVQFFVEDEGAFTMPWSAQTDYRPRAGFSGYLDEQICQENNRALGPRIEPLIPRDANYRYPY